MIIDLHIHEKTFSPDTDMGIQEIVKSAKSRGLDGVCITDHDNIGFKDYAKYWSEKLNFCILSGVEYYSLQGDIIAFGIESIPNKRVDAQEFIDYVNECGGFCYSAHPFRNNKRGLEVNLDIVTGLGGIEVLNGSTCYENNQKAFQYCRKLGIATVGASDAHIQDKVGVYATQLPFEVHDVEELVRALKSGECEAMKWTQNGYQKCSDMYFNIK